MNKKSRCILINTEFHYLICSYYDNGECLSPKTKEELCLPKLKELNENRGFN